MIAKPLRIIFQLEMNPHFIRSGVKPLDRGTYLVESASENGKEHHVDVTSFFGAGKCSCYDYRCRREAANAAIGPLQDEMPSRCRHLKIVRAYMADLVTAGFIKVDGKQKDGP